MMLKGGFRGFDAGFSVEDQPVVTFPGYRFLGARVLRHFFVAGAAAFLFVSCMGGASATAREKEKREGKVLKEKLQQAPLEDVSDDVFNSVLEDPEKVSEYCEVSKGLSRSRKAAIGAAVAAAYTEYLDNKKTNQASTIASSVCSCDSGKNSVSASFSQGVGKNGQGGCFSGKENHESGKFSEREGGEHLFEPGSGGGRGSGIPSDN